MGAIVAALLPLVLLMPSLPSATPVVRAAWQSYVAWLDAPLGAALTRIAWLMPIGSDGTRQSALALAMICAACASVFVLLDVAIARAARAFELAPVLRAPVALALTWALLVQALTLEPVIVRLGPVALVIAVAVGCFALRFRVSTDRLIDVLERARGRSAAERRPSALALAVAGTFMALGALYLRGAAQSSSELRSDASEALREALVYRAAPRSVLIMSEQLTASSARAVLAMRPDVEVIDVSALFDVKGAEALAGRRPELTALIRASLLHGALDAPELQAFAAQRPVRLALPLGMLASVREVLVPAGLLSEVTTSSVTTGDLGLARRANEDYVTALLGELALGEVDAATRGWVRDQCVLIAALVSPLSRGAFLAEYLDRARLLTHDAADKKGLVAALVTMGIPAAAAQ